MSLAPDALAALCDAAMPHEQLTAAELQRVCYAPDATVAGDEDGAVAYTLQRHGEHVATWILLVAVAPEHQRRGLGSRLVRGALDDARDRGARSAHLANAVPRYLWPGVELTNTRAGMLFETLGFTPDLVGINMSIPASFRHPPPEGIVVERECGTDARDFAVRAFPSWVEELDAAVAQGTAFAARDTASGATVGFGCHSANRAAWIGPMATDPDAQRGGIGSAVLAAVCEDLAATGYDAGEIAWVSNLRFYGKCGAAVSRVFQGGHLPL